MNPETTPFTPAQIADYLRSIGFDLPSYHLGGSNLRDAGLAVYETENQPVNGTSAIP